MPKLTAKVWGQPNWADKFYDSIGVNKVYESI